MGLTFFLAIILVILETNLFETFVWPPIAPILGGNNSDAELILNFAFVALGGSIAVPLAWLITRTIYKAFGLQP